MPHHYNDKCLACKRRLGASHGRGLCARCYEKAWRDVKAGLATWQEFEDKGVAKPVVRKGTK